MVQGIKHALSAVIPHGQRERLVVPRLGLGFFKQVSIDACTGLDRVLGYAWDRAREWLGFARGLGGWRGQKKVLSGPSPP